MAGLSSLPRYETIVEDLTRLLERNRLVERLDHIMRGMEKDLTYGMPLKTEKLKLRTGGSCLNRLMSRRGRPRFSIEPHLLVKASKTKGKPALDDSQLPFPFGGAQLSILDATSTETDY